MAERTFYAAIVDKLKELGDKIVIRNPSRQVASNPWFPPAQLFAIGNVESAVRGLDIIVRQDEGTSDNPLDADDAPAHYDRFAEIYYGRRLVPDPTVKEKYSYSGAPLPFGTAGIWDGGRSEGCKLSRRKCPRAYAERFNGIYTDLLNNLHVTFNGQPQQLSKAIGAMYELRLAAEALIEVRDARSGKQAAPTFEYYLDNA
jgi:hypothetical protein